MIKDEIINAYNYSMYAHEDQKRKFSDLDFFTHPKAVARRVEELHGSKLLIIISFLHDTIEDTVVEYDDIEREFGVDVADGVMELTSDRSEIKKLGKVKYLTQKMKNMSEDILFIKLADREHNIKFLAKDTDLSSEVSRKFLKKYYFETKAIMENISDICSITRRSKILIDSINVILSELDYRFNLE